MEIPYQKIPHEILINMIREFIMREGTDYTHRDISIEEKIEQVEPACNSMNVYIF